MTIMKCYGVTPSSQFYPGICNKRQKWFNFFSDNNTFVLRKSQPRNWCGKCFPAILIITNYCSSFVIPDAIQRTNVCSVLFILGAEGCVHRRFYTRWELFVDPQTNVHVNTRTTRTSTRNWLFLLQGPPIIMPDSDGGDDNTFDLDEMCIWCPVQLMLILDNAEVEESMGNWNIIRELA